MKETQRQTDKSQREGPEAETKVNVYSVGPEEEGREETWEIIALDMGEASIGSPTPTPHCQTPFTPGSSLPLSRHCPSPALFLARATERILLYPVPWGQGDEEGVRTGPHTLVVLHLGTGETQPQGGDGMACPNLTSSPVPVKEAGEEKTEEEWRDGCRKPPTSAAKPQDTRLHLHANIHRASELGGEGSSGSRTFHSLNQEAIPCIPGHCQP